MAKLGAIVVSDCLSAGIGFACGKSTESGDHVSTSLLIDLCLDHFEMTHDSRAHFFHEINFLFGQTLVRRVVQNTESTNL